MSGPDRIQDDDMKKAGAWGNPPASDEDQLLFVQTFKYKGVLAIQAK